MNIQKGFQLHSPRVFVSWGASSFDLEALFVGATSAKKVIEGYYTISAEPLLGLKCLLGFHLHDTGKLNRLEFFRSDYPDQKASFEDFQNHFEIAFGKPNSTTAGTAGFPNHVWNLGAVKISHYVFERFGPEEHMEITKL
jgi:hypothetical protein